MTINYYDCKYVDAKGNQRTWVTPGKDAYHVRLSFDEMVGEGRIVSIRRTHNYDW